MTPTVGTEADTYRRLRHLIDPPEPRGPHAPPDPGLRATLTTLVPDSLLNHQPTGGPLPDPLRGVDPLTAPTTGPLVPAAFRYITTLDLDASHPDDRTDLTWGAYTYAATRQICGRFSLATMQAGHTFTAILARSHLHAQAAAAGLEQLMICARNYGPTGDLTIHTGVQLGVHRLQAGRCHHAYTGVTDLLDRWRTAHPQPTLFAANILIHLAAMARHCGQPAAASHHQHQAQAVARQLDAHRRSVIAMRTEHLYPLVHDHHLVCQRPHLTVPTPSLSRPPQSRRPPQRPACGTRPASPHD